jgi:hypothetical protein
LYYFALVLTVSMFLNIHCPFQREDEALSPTDSRVGLVSPSGQWDMKGHDMFDLQREAL